MTASLRSESQPTSGRSAIGIIGPGAMGTPMAVQLIDAGNDVVYFSRRENPTLDARGAKRARTPRDLAQQAANIVAMLPDLPQLLPMLEGEDSLLSANEELLLMVGSTSSAVQLKALAEQVAIETSGKVDLIDSPVSGGVEGARQGTLSIMIGGTDEQYARARSVLRHCGTTHHLGPLGTGQVAKTCNQIVVAASMLALGESTVLAEKSGIQPAKLLEVLSGGYAGSTLLNAKKDKLISGDYEPNGIAAYMLKDLGFAVDIAKFVEMSPVLLPSLQVAYKELVDSGMGDEDLAVVRKFIQKRSAAKKSAQRVNEGA